MKCNLEQMINLMALFRAVGCRVFRKRVKEGKFFFMVIRKDPQTDMEVPLTFMWHKGVIEESRLSSPDVDEKFISEEMKEITDVLEKRLKGMVE